MRCIQLRYPFSHSTIGCSATAEALSGLRWKFCPDGRWWMMCMWAGGSRLWKVETSFWLGRGRASESKKRKEMRRGRNVVNRHEKLGPWPSIERTGSRKGRTAEGPIWKNVTFTLRNILFRGLLDEEEDWKKSEEMERMGRVWGRIWNWSEEEGRGGGKDMGGKEGGTRKVRVRSTLALYNWLGRTRALRARNFDFHLFTVLPMNILPLGQSIFDIHGYIMFYLFPHSTFSVCQIWFRAWSLVSVCTGEQYQ
jgi:hypothetical protein